MTTNTSSVGITANTSDTVIYTATAPTICFGLTAANDGIAGTLSVWVVSGGVTTYLVNAINFPAAATAIIAGGVAPKFTLKSGDVLHAKTTLTTADILASFVQLT